MKLKIFLRIFIVAIFLFCQFLPLSDFQKTYSTPKASAETDPDYDAYQKYEKYLLYDKYRKYRKYKEYKKYKEKYGFDSSSEKAKAKDGYEKYKLFKKNPGQYASFGAFYDDYKKYSRYKKYVTPNKKYSRYKKYKRYDKKQYKEGKNYGGSAYKQGHARYLESQRNGGLGEATLGGGVLGPDITVGIHSYAKNELGSDYIRFKANKQYIAKNSNNEIIATIDADAITKVKYDSNNNFKFYDPLDVSSLINADIYFESADGNNTDLILAIEQTDNEAGDYDQYRGKINVHLYDPSGSDNDRIWIINTLPLEHYVWGIGEITGTGDMDYNKTMSIMFRTYGYWKIRWSTQYSAQGFDVVSTSSNQIYNGYDWEESHPRIKEATEDTQGKIMMYGDEIALSPYSSWTDGRTRSFEERWGSKLYPWCQSVTDTYGKHATMSTAELVASGNHMVGLSANGALNLATDHDYDHLDILRYYFYKVRFQKAY